MQRVAQVVALGSLASSVVAVARTGFEFPDSVPMHKRQTSGPSYECHANCGYTILGAKTEGYCDDTEWQDLLEQCLACANEFDLWPDYGEGVTAAAEGCGLDATPVGSNEGSDEQTTTEPAATSTDEVSTSVVVEPTSEPTADSTEVETFTTTWEATLTQTHSESQATVSVPTPTSATNSTVPEPTNEPAPVPTGGAAHSWASGSLVAGAAMLVALNLM